MAGLTKSTRQLSKAKHRYKPHYHLHGIIAQITYHVFVDVAVIEREKSGTELKNYKSQTSQTDEIESKSGCLQTQDLRKIS